MKDAASFTQMDTEHNETIAGLPAQLPDPRNPNQSLL